MIPDLTGKKAKIGELYHGETVGDVDLLSFFPSFTSQAEHNSYRSNWRFRIDDNTPVGG